MSHIFRVYYRLDDSVSSGQTQTAGSLRVVAASREKAATAARPIINIMRGRQFTKDEIKIESVQRADDEVTIHTR